MNKQLIEQFKRDSCLSIPEILNRPFPKDLNPKREDNYVPPLTRVVRYVIVKTPDRKVFAIKDLKEKTLVSDWLSEDEILRYILKYHKDTWFYLFNQVFTD